MALAFFNANAVQWYSNSTLMGQLNLTNNFIKDEMKTRINDIN